MQEEQFKLQKPEWIKVKAPQSEGFKNTYNLSRKLKLNTVCEEAACPNIGECWQKKTCNLYDSWFSLH